MDYVTEDRLIELLGAMEGRINKNADDAHARIGERVDELGLRIEGLSSRTDGLCSRMDGLDTKIVHLAEDVKRIDRNVVKITKVLPTDM